MVLYETANQVCHILTRVVVEVRLDCQASGSLEAARAPYIVFQALCLRPASVGEDWTTTVTMTSQQTENPRASQLLYFQVPEYSIIMKVGVLGSDFWIRCKYMQAQSFTNYGCYPFIIYNQLRFL